MVSQSSLRRPTQRPSRSWSHRTRPGQHSATLPASRLAAELDSAERPSRIGQNLQAAQQAIWALAHAKLGTMNRRTVNHKAVAESRRSETGRLTVNLKRKLAVAALVGSGLGLTGCQGPSTGGLAFWKNNTAGGVASATPDVGKQRYEGLNKEFGKPPATALGGQKPADDNFLTASWKKTTGAVSGAFAAKPASGESSDPLRLDQPLKKVGPEIHVGAAQLMENQGKFAEAEMHYQKAPQVAPNDLNAAGGSGPDARPAGPCPTGNRGLSARPQGPSAKRAGLE